jgi:non-homologous end joining protein Ku
LRRYPDGLALGVDVPAGAAVDHLDEVLLVPEVDTPKEMIDLAIHIIGTMPGHFDPAKFEDRYETAMRDPIKRN